MSFRSFLFVLFLLPFSFSSISQVVINEIMAANATSLLETDFYNFPDYLEIYNSGNTGINLGDYYLSDDQDNLFKWQLPASTLAAEQYYLLYCDKENTGKHANFGLSADGETVYLTFKDGSPVDLVTYGPQFTDISFGRDPSDPVQWYYCAVPTPGTVNTITTATTLSPVAGYSMDAGRLSSSVSLVLSGNSIKYTTDGSDPKTTSLSYSQPIAINKTMTVKSKRFQDDYLPGKTYANTYFLNEHSFTLPVVVLSFTPDYFYDNIIGIHVRGTNGTEGNCGTVANWNQNWERAAYLEYFEPDGKKKISQPVGVKLAGGCTRGRDQKSISIYARSKYGNNDFDYAVFKQKPEINSYKSLLLRNSGNDQDQTLLRDAFLQALVNQSMDIDFQSYQPAIVYFNNEYRGIMNLREKTDEDYFLSNYAIGSDEVDFLEGVLRADADNCYAVIRGSSADYINMMAYISSNSLTDNDSYNLVASQLDLQEYINYMTLQIYIANRDWPGNNLKFWRKAVNGKWRWIVFDLDYGFGFRLDDNGYKHETFDFATAADGPDHPNPPWSTLLFRKLLENEGFKKRFLSTFIAHIYSSFTPEWCNYVLDSLSNRIDFEITYNQIKYGRTKEQWLQYLNTLKQYAINRQDFMPDYMKSFFNISSDTVNVIVSNPDPLKGKVDVNHALIQMYPFIMKTYHEVPLTLKAFPAKGYRFVRWNYSGTTTVFSELNEIRSDSSYHLAIEPVFEPTDETDGIFLNEIAATTSLFRDEYDEKSGFVELYNNTSEDIGLFSFFISDDANNLLRYAIPDSTLIPAYGFITFYLDGEAKQGSLHTAFKADPDGESIYLSQKVGDIITLLDSASFELLIADHSFGKYADGTGSWQHMVKMTPGQPNDPEILNQIKISDELACHFNIYPNPSDGNLFISVDEDNMHTFFYSVDVIDIYGKVVYPKIWLNSNYSSLNLSNLNQGMYFIRLYKDLQPFYVSKLILLK
jgi:hypothetical protein